MQSATK
jgi:hypothetical protein